MKVEVKLREQSELVRGKWGMERGKEEEHRLNNIYLYENILT